ncbi:MAG: glycoside hydrolase family 28 protein [Desulfobacteraceae bacterium]|jgi:polygalacturonase
MQPVILAITSRSAVFELRHSEGPELAAPLPIHVDDDLVCEVSQSVFSLNELQPNHDYRVRVGGDCEVAFQTKSETAALDIRAFGARNGGFDNTPAIMAAIAACPAGGTVIIPPGLWLSGPLFLKSDITIYLSPGATLSGQSERDRYPILPGQIPGQKGSDLFWGSWEGDAQDCFAALITGLGIENVNLAGGGEIDADAWSGDWWEHPREKMRAFRPRTIYFNRCKNILLHGLTVRHSPSWTIHPLSCREVKFYDFSVENPKISPNTDGLNPESCTGVEIVGGRFSVGDDCIAIKSGRVAPDKSVADPCQHIVIRRCLMEYGHGAVVIGSEMSGGVSDVEISHCLFRHTDRGLRIKTRRGRGKDGVITDIQMHHVLMEAVADPLVINCFYNCDPDGDSDYVQQKSALPIDDRTPEVHHIRVEKVTATGAAHAACFIWGLPEKPVTGLVLRDIRVTYADEAEPGQPAMARDVPSMRHAGFVLLNVSAPVIENVIAVGVKGASFPAAGELGL